MRFRILPTQLFINCRTRPEIDSCRYHNAISRQQAQFNNGFSLVETTATIAILSVLLSVAAPRLRAI